MTTMPPAGAFRRTTIAEPGLNGLRHLPGADGLNRLPFYDTIRFMRDPLGYTQRAYERFGPVFRVNHWGGWHAVLLGPDALEMVLFDRERIFSSQEGWGPLLWRLFPRGLMLMDFDEHRMNRRAIGAAFKPEPMRAYHDALSEGIAARIDRWAQQGTLRIYPAIKQLTLDLAATAFLGVPLGPEADRIGRLLMDMVQAAVAPIRTPIPGTRMARGVAARAELSAFFTGEITRRRGSNRRDMLSFLCNLDPQDGGPMPDDLIIDHMNFMLMAAHDTLTSSLSATIHRLAIDHDWQDLLAAEVRGVAAASGGTLPPEALGELKLTEMLFKEVLRLMPPVPSLPRRALRDFEFGGYRVPAGAHVGVNPMFTHRMADHWPDPDRFDPRRFTPEAVRTRHKYAWVPFGGGAHMCIGLHYALMQARIFLFHLLKRYRVRLGRAGAGERWQLVPLPKPLDGLPIRLEQS